MNDTFEFTLNNPLTEEQWNMIADVDMERTDSVTFHTKHGKEVEFAKVRHGEWVEYPKCLEYENALTDEHIVCSCCGEVFNVMDNDTYRFKYCPNCGAKMDGAERKENEQTTDKGC